MLERISKTTLPGKLVAGLILAASCLTAQADTVVTFDSTASLSDNGLSFTHRDYRWLPLPWSISNGAIALYLQSGGDAQLRSTQSALASISVHTDAAYAGTSLVLSAFNPSSGLTQLGTVNLSTSTTVFNFTGGLPSYYTLVLTANPSTMLYIDQLTLTNVTAVPEPASALLMLGGLLIVGTAAWRRRQSFTKGLPA